MTPSFRIELWRVKRAIEASQAEIDLLILIGSTAADVQVERDRLQAMKRKRDLLKALP